MDWKDTSSRLLSLSPLSHSLPLSCHKLIQSMEVADCSSRCSASLAHHQLVGARASWCGWAKSFAKKLGKKFAGPKAKQLTFFMHFLTHQRNNFLYPINSFTCAPLECFYPMQKRPAQKVTNELATLNFWQKRNKCKWNKCFCLPIVAEEQKLLVTLNGVKDKIKSE